MPCPYERLAGRADERRFGDMADPVERAVRGQGGALPLRELSDQVRRGLPQRGQAVCLVE